RFAPYTFPSTTAAANQHATLVVFLAAVASSARSGPRSNWGNDTRRIGRFGCTEPSPIRHETGALGEQVAATVSRFHFVADHMSQRHFDYMICVVGPLGRPIAKRGTKSMYSYVVTPDTLEKLRHCHVADGSALAAAGENEVRFAR